MNCFCGFHMASVKNCIYVFMNLIIGKIVLHLFLKNETTYTCILKDFKNATLDSMPISSRIPNNSSQ